MKIRETMKKVASVIWSGVLWLCDAVLKCLDWLATKYLELRVKK